ncbi:phosphoglycerate kinase [Membranicola marinus]|uniref:Phosphoglycerate kinase n=1 Tax=Membranihabitans marinus TaxID=1227546 RepID=A0A953HL31_9BACT|nr:phosphoglycerate kinase [Membranihabitans marinus]MBY5957894.1 phosphoglycerate kinase [Membranihabitans marinus]
MKKDYQGKKVLVRVDFNVPLDDQYNITDDTRIQAALPTIQELLDNNAAVILMSHLGRPQKKKKEDGSIDRDRFTLRHVVDHLALLVGQSIEFAADTVGEDARQKADAIRPGDVLLLENTRFEPGEEKGDEDLARKMSELADYFVNDAFGTAHRAHASTTKVAQFFDQEHKSFGFLMEKELNNAEVVRSNPQKPYTAVIGGAKVSDKIGLLENLLGKCDYILVGGGMAYTFFRAYGGKIGNSLVEEDKLELAKELLHNATKKHTEIILPQDSVIADQFSNDAQTQTVASDQIPDGWMGLDIGPKAIKRFSEIIEKSKTVMWNGPMGVFEMEKFASGSIAIAEAMAEATKRGAFTMVGGGDSVSAVNQSGESDNISFISTGGGAMLEYLEGKTLPGVAAISND